jgi:hypothetical protein
VVVWEGPPVILAPDANQTATIPCGNPDERAVSGGWNFPIPGPTAYGNFPTYFGSPATSGDTPNGWGFSFNNTTGSTSVGSVYVTCVSP